MVKNPLLLPNPRYLILDKGSLDLQDGRLIVIDGANAPALRLSAVRLQQALAKNGLSWDIAAGARRERSRGYTILVRLCHPPDHGCGAAGCNKGERQ